MDMKFPPVTAGMKDGGRREVEKTRHVAHGFHGSVPAAVRWNTYVQVQAAGATPNVSGASMVQVPATSHPLCCGGAERGNEGVNARWGMVVGKENAVGREPNVVHWV